MRTFTPLSVTCSTMRIWSRPWASLWSISATEHVTDNGVKVRIELEEGVLRAIGTAVAEGQRSAQGGF
jgi:hypothetical protein